MVSDSWPIESLDGLAQHVAEIPNAINGLVGISIRSQTYGTITDAITDHASVFTHAQLTKLQTLLNRNASGQILSLTGDRIEMLDLIQRTYSTSDLGGGHITPEGLLVISDSFSFDQPRRTDASMLDRLIHAFMTPPMLIIFPSRETLIDELNDNQQLANEDHSIPMWEQPESRLQRKLEDRSKFDHVRFLIVDIRITHWWASRKTSTQHEAIRDGVLIGIALEQYHRAHATWPESLDALVPVYLPQVPVDPITGGPLLYRMVDGEPMVYSVGQDRDDDEGRVPLTKHWKSGEPEPDPWAAASWDEPDVLHPVDGDWILFPQLDTPMEAGREATREAAKWAEREAAGDGYASQYSY